MQFEDFDKLFDEAKTLASSKKAHMTNFKRVIRDVFNGVIPKDMSGSETTQAILAYVSKDEVKQSVKLGLLNSFLKCVSFLKTDYSKMEQAFNEFKQPIKAQQISTPTEKAAENIIPMSAVVSKRDEWKARLSAEFSKDDIYYLIGCCYTYIPPLRTQDWINSLYFEDAGHLIKSNPDKVNYFCQKTKTLYLSKYKTEKAYGERKVAIPDELCEALRTFHQKTGSDYVICTPTKKQYLQNGFHRDMTKAVGEGIGSSMLRNIFISENVADKCLTGSERLQIANDMGHSVATASVRYSKFSKLFQGDSEDLESLKERRAILEQLLKETNEKISKFQ